jgi:hypothetical protein
MKYINSRVRSGDFVRTIEILFLIVTFTLCFVTTELIIAHFVIFEAFRRFLIRLIFLAQYSVLIYYLFDYVSHIFEKDDGNICSGESEEE